MRVFTYDFMQRALLAGAIVGLSAPAIGTYVVQKRLSLLGDGLGHVAFTGVAAGFLLEVSPVLMAIVFAVAGAIAIELIRERSKASGDVALALIFYGGIAGGVLLISLAEESVSSLSGFLFGSVVTVGTDDLVLVGAVATVVLVVALGLRKHLFAVAYDEDVARASGLPVRTLNILTAVVTAMTIAVTAKVVGILLVAAMLVLPVAAVQQLAGSFRATMFGAMALGTAVTVGGLIGSFYLDVLPAATIVLSLIGCFILAATLSAVRSR